MSVRVLHGDCVELMRAMPECSVDAIVTDPPYGLEFMGKDWDSFKTGRAAKYAKGGELHDPEERRGKGGAGPSYVNRPAKRCGECGKQAWSGSPCKCEKPLWVLDNSPLHAFQDWFTVVAAEALRVLKPGGHLLAFGGTRTYHRMACAIEDAGFEIRDSIHWVYGSGFPKSLNVSKSIEGLLTTGSAQKNGFHRLPGEGLGGGSIGMYDDVEEQGFRKRQPKQHGARSLDATTEEAKRWEGWGTALKPAHEPIVVARKPLSGTVAGNVLVWGTGGLNIDGCRVGTDGATKRATNPQHLGRDNMADFTRGNFGVESLPAGRWPANVVFDRTAGEALDQQSGEVGSLVTGKTGNRRGGNSKHSVGLNGPKNAPDGYGDSGGASRFFTQADFGPDDWPFVYQAKPSRKERNAGLDGLPEKRPDQRTTTGMGTFEEKGVAKQSNHHPTVKPVALMRHLVRLVTPPGGTVLDPFAGSGTTLVAAVLEGFDAVGCEMTDEYLPIIEGRVAWAEEQAASRGAEQARLL
jgi:DNA modification methylase